MGVWHSSEIASGRHDVRVVIETHHEHHMGASTVLIRPSRPLCGVAEFDTTNGAAFFTPDGGGLIVHDAAVIVFIDLAADSAHHVRPKRGWYFTNVRIEEDTLRTDLFDGAGQREVAVPVPLRNLAAWFAPGFGPVSDGRFPSAYSLDDEHDADDEFTVP